MADYVSYKDAVDSAASLLESAETPENVEYRRGQFETLARMFPIKEVDTGQRAEEIARDVIARIGLSER